MEDDKDAKVAGNPQPAQPINQPRQPAGQSKKFHLSDREKQNIISRHQLMEQYQYQVRLIEADIRNYVLNVICPSRSISSTVKVKISEDFEWLEVMENGDSGKK